MSLDLGLVRFDQERGRYASPEKRRRQRRAKSIQRAKPSPSSRPPGRTETVARLAPGDTPSQIAELSILPDTLAPRDIAFSLGATRERMGRSVAAAFASHVLGVLIIAVLMSLAPERVIELVQPNRENYGIVWIPEEGPGGGGGGGGNESLEMPRPVEIEGPDESELSVPVEVERDFVEPEPEQEPEEIQAMNIPAVTMASALESLPGVMDHIDAARETLSQGSGSGGGGGTGTGTGIGPGEGAGLGPGEGGGVGGGVYRPGAGIENPQPLRMVDPQYTAEAMRAQVQGEVWLSVVVLPDGSIGDISVTRSLDPVFGLDEEAVKSARLWRWAPGTRFGEPVAVVVQIAVSFNLR